MGLFRRLLNLVLAPLPIIVTVLAFGQGTSFDQATASPDQDPPVVPAGYAFVIWSAIYVGSVFYGIYQYGPSREDDPVLERIRPFTASAFTATVCWLIAARFNQSGLTVICILWLLGSLLPVFLTFRESRRRFRVAEQVAMVVPLSIYTGWVMVAVFANISVFLNEYGLLDRVLNPAAWAVIMVVAAGVLAATLTVRSGNVAFALTVCWALIAILVANLTRERNLSVAITCGTMAALQLGALTYFRRSQSSERVP